MIDSIKCLFEVQEENNTEPALVYVTLNRIEKLDEAGPSGVSLPEL